MSALAGGLVAATTFLVVARATRSARVARRALGAAHHTETDRWVVRWVGAVAAWSRRSRVRRAGITPNAVVAWCDDIARRVRSGDTLREAVRCAEPADVALAESTAEVRSGLDRGRTLTAVITACAARNEAEEVRGRRHLGLACAAISTAAQLGGSTATALDRVGVTLRLRAADEQERAAHSAQARLSAHVLTLVPIGIVVVLAATDPAVRATISTPVGVSTLALGLVLNTAGWWWMRHIIGSER